MTASSEVVADETLIALALAAAERAEEVGEVPVGAVLALPDGRRFTAHNAPISTLDPTAHAEIRVIRAACAAVGDYRLNGAVLAVTLEPCLMCCGAIIHARIDRLIYGADDPKGGAVRSLYQTLNDPRLNHRPRLRSGLEAERCGRLLQRFFRRRRAGAGD